MPATAPLQIGRLRTRAPAAAAVPARLAAEALVGQIEPALPGLPPQCVLLLRRLALPVARRTLVHWHDGATRLQFAARAQARLAEAARHALRPALQPVGEQAEAVLFGDEAELLACLARDAAAGQLQRWWWQTWLGQQRADASDWPRAFAERPDAGPGALRWLRAWGLEGWVTQQLAGRPQGGGGAAGARSGARPGPADPEERTAVHATTRPEAGAVGLAGTADGASPVVGGAGRGGSVWDVAGADDLRRAADWPDAGQTLPGAPATGTARPPLAGDLPPTPPTRQRRAPAPEVGAGSAVGPAPPPAEAAGGAPAAARADAGHAVDAGERPAKNTHPPGRSAGAPALPAARDELRAPVGTPAAGLPGDVPADRPTNPTRLAARRDRRTDPPVPPHPLAAALAALWPADSTTAGRSRPVGARAGITHDRRVTAPLAAGAAPIGPDRSIAAAAADAPLRPVATAWGGVFFLVNGLLARGWLADFSQPAGAGLPVPPWRLLAWLALRLAGPALRRDPLWSLLQALDGGAHPLPGPGRRSWRQPAAARGLPHGARRPVTAPAPPARRCWQALASGLRDELALHLGLPPAPAMARLLQQPARVWVTAGEVVVVFSLQQHPVEVRLAGLDRDPGFLPAAGRSLRFVFD